MKTFWFIFIAYDQESIQCLNDYVDGSWKELLQKNHVKDSYVACTLDSYETTLVEFLSGWSQSIKLKSSILVQCFDYFFEIQILVLIHIVN